MARFGEGLDWKVVLRGGELLMVATRCGCWQCPTAEEWDARVRENAGWGKNCVT